MDNVFELHGSTLAGIGAVLGALSAAVTFLFKALIESKDKTIAELISERDYWRDVAMGTVEIRPYHERTPPPSNQPPQSYRH